ncbi:MAG: hypothetical protein NVS4B3_08740 [Gemmatimonadaceae bacterium]
MKAILLIDHGSKRPESNEMLACMSNLLQTMLGSDVIVRYAHMELAEPSIGDGFASCVDAGATDVIAFPYMLSPGKHSTSDIPRLVAAARAAHPAVRCRVTTAFGVHEKLAEIILERAECVATTVLSSAMACRCWHPTGGSGTCGGACRLQPVEVGVSAATV